MNGILEKPRERVTPAQQIADAISTLRGSAVLGLALLSPSTFARLVSIADQHMQRERFDDAVRILLGSVHRALRSGRDAEAVRAELQRIGTAAVAPHLGLSGTVDLFKPAKLEPKPTSAA